jgi:hypothetical protein
MENFDEPSDLRRFPLSVDDILQMKKIITFMREQLTTMSPAHVRSAASVLLALERLPVVTPGIQVTFGFVQRNTDGNYGWADIAISEDELRFGIGEHFYDPSVGGDTESRIAFEAMAGGDAAEGDIDDWLSVARVVATEGDISVEDYLDYELIEWTNETDQGEKDEPEYNPNSPAASNEPVPSQEELLHIFNEASAPMSEHLREQLAYRHMIALADVFEGRALDKRLTAEQSVRLVGWA